MLSPLRTRFGIPGVIAVIALVFAMLGGAYAANNSSSGGKATASAKAKKGPRGPKGAAGPTGPAGANGTNGAKGDKGDSGPAGAAGPAGPAGTQGLGGKDGKGILSNPIEAEPGEETCDEQGGAEYEVEDSGDPTIICNGKEGSPWTAGGTLPPGAVETGMWYVPTEGDGYGTISFSIPVATQIEEGHYFYGMGTDFETGTEFTEHCPGPTFQSPEVAHAGDLCIYAPSLIFNFGPKFQHLTSIPGTVETLTKQGGFLSFVMNGTIKYASGSFAVKGCSPTSEPDKCP